MPPLLRFLEGNAAFRRAVLALCDPVVIGAVLLMLVNDHVFKHLWASWWTGKLSDAAWVVFAPLLLALLISWTIPQRVPIQERLVAWLSFGSVGLGYALFNLSEGFHSVSVRALSTVIGGEVVMARDATDALMILPGLVAGWWVWQRQDIAFFVRHLRESAVRAAATTVPEAPPPPGAAASGSP